VLRVLLRQLLERFELLSQGILVECLDRKKQGAKVGSKTWMRWLTTAISEFHEISSNPVCILVPTTSFRTQAIANKRMADDSLVDHHNKKTKETADPKMCFVFISVHLMCLDFVSVL
jgi:hypothetical protein